MTREELYYIGHLSKTTGTQGALLLVLEKIDGAFFERQPALFVQLAPDYVPFMVSACEALNNKRYVVFFEDVETPEHAERLSGQNVFIPSAEVPAAGNSLPESVNGFKVEDEELGALGTVTGVLDNPAHELLVMRYKEREVLIPVTDTIIKGIDSSARVIYTALPEGLLDL
jgi:16S rRNA processing protein RimM